MKKLYLLFGTIILVVGLTMYLYNREGEYDFLLQLDKCSRLGFTNPIDSFTEVYHSFEGIGQNNDFWGGLFDAIGAIGNMLICPFKFIYELLKNLWLLMESLLIMLGFNV